MALTRISGIGATGDQTFSIDQLIDKNLQALSNVPIYNRANDSASPVTTIAAGNSVGTLYSWLDANPLEGRNETWFMFAASPDQMSFADYGGFYYVPLHSGYFDVQNLIDQGTLTVAQATALANAAAPTLMTYISKYLPWILLTVGVVAFGKEFIKDKISK